MWDLPGPGFEPVSPPLAGGFLTTEPPGKPFLSSLMAAPCFLLSYSPSPECSVPFSTSKSESTASSVSDWSPWSSSSPESSVKPHKLSGRAHPPPLPSGAQRAGALRSSEGPAPQTPTARGPRTSPSHCSHSMVLGAQSPHHYLQAAGSLEIIFKSRIGTNYTVL